MKENVKRVGAYVFVGIFLLLVTASPSYSGWAQGCKVTYVNMLGSTGNAVVSAQCGNTFGRVTIADTQAGADRMLAAILTSIAMNTTININTDGDFDSTGKVAIGIALSGSN